MWQASQEANPWVIPAARSALASSALVRPIRWHSTHPAGSPGVISREPWNAGMARTAAQARACLPRRARELPGPVSTEGLIRLRVNGAE